MHKVLKINKKLQKFKEGFVGMIVLCLAVSSVFLSGHLLFEAFWNGYISASSGFVIYGHL